MAASTKSAIVQVQTKTSPDIEFAYLPVPRESLGPDPETLKDKFLRKFKENPFVPLGLCLTTFALSFGLWQMRTGNRVMSQKMMRLRIGAQGITVAAVLIGVIYGTSEKSSKE